jgi:hypothetical protein
MRSLALIACTLALALALSGAWAGTARPCTLILAVDRIGPDDAPRCVPRWREPVPRSI